MNKYFQLADVAFAILAATLLVRWPRIAIIAVLAFSALSPAAIAIWHLRSDTVALSVGQEQAGRWIAANTPGNAVFVTDAWINSPVDLAGRVRLSGFGPYVSNLGYDPTLREAQIKSIYCDGDATARTVMAATGASYVLSSGTNLDCGHPPTDFSKSPLFETVYQSGGVTVWRLR
jgi:hypothetical protein